MNATPAFQLTTPTYIPHANQRSIEQAYTPATPHTVASLQESQPSPAASDYIANFSDVELICNVDPERVRGRWMESFLPRDDQRPKILSPGTTYFILNILRSYPRKLATAAIPPIIHPSQANRNFPVALSNCANIARMWEGRIAGSEALITDTITREMDRLFGARHSYNQSTLLSAFQAYTIYAIMLLDLSPDGQELVIPREIMLNLQEFAFEIARTGLITPAEQSHTRPEWEAWIIAEAKRRALFAMYMLDDVVNTLGNVPCILGDELAAVPAPSSKVLWGATRREVWRVEYDAHVSGWRDGGLRLEELWGGHGVPGRQGRVDRWLAAMDEFGMTVFAVTSVTHTK